MANYSEIFFVCEKILLSRKLKADNKELSITDWMTNNSIRCEEVEEFLFDLEFKLLRQEDAYKKIWLAINNFIQIYSAF